MFRRIVVVIDGGNIVSYSGKLGGWGETFRFFGAKREFCGENFRGLLRYVQLLCGRGHKILRRKLSRMVLTPRKMQKFSPSEVFHYTVVSAAVKSNRP